MGRLAVNASSAVFWAGLLDGMEIKQAEGNHSPDSDRDTNTSCSHHQTSCKLKQASLMLLPSAIFALALR